MVRRAGRAEIHSRGAQADARGCWNKPFTWASFPTTSRKKPFQLSKALQSGLPRRADGTLCSPKHPRDATAAVSTSALACSSSVFPCTDQSWASFYSGFNISQQCWKHFLGMTLAFSQPSPSSRAQPPQPQSQRSGCLLQYCQLGITSDRVYLAVCPEAECQGTIQPSHSDPS